MSSKTQEAALFKSFLGDASIMLVEPSPVFSANIQHCLTSMGIGAQQIVIVKRYEDAVKRIEVSKPKMLVTEYQIEGRFGLSLLEKMEKFYSENARISFLVTKNSSDSVVAGAAEEQVDAFLLKPFSADVFKQRLLKVLQKKCSPSPYDVALDAGKKQLLQKDYAQAITHFVHAKTLASKPSLACCYVGQCYQAQNNVMAALAEYQEGRKYQSLHYKCLVAEFEILILLKKYNEAFEMVALLKDNYPLTPRRLEQIFVATVMARKFENIDSYFELLTKLEQRPPSLIKIASLALLAAGRSFLAAKNVKAAVESFDRGLTVAGREFPFLQAIVKDLMKSSLHEDAQRFLTKAPASLIGTPEFSCLTFQVDQAFLGVDQLIDRGKKLAMSGQGNAEIYRSVVQLMVKGGKTTLAESVIARAVEHLPEMRAELYGLLENPGVGVSGQASSPDSIAPAAPANPGAAAQPAHK